MIGIVGYLSAKVVGTFVKAFGIQEEAVVTLNAALKATGKYTEEASQKIQRVASELQEVTRHGDEALLAAVSAIAQLAKGLDVDQLADAQKIIIGIADTFLKGNLESAALLVGKTIGSATNALSRYGIQLDASASEQDKFNDLLAQSQTFFQVSVDSTDSLRGASEQLKNTWGDLQETIGEIIVEIFGYEESIKSLRTGIKDFDDRLKEDMSTVILWGKAIVRTLGAIIGTATGTIKFFVKVGMVIGAAFETAASLAIRAVMELVNQVIGGLNWLLEKATGGINSLIRGLNMIPGVELGEIKPLVIEPINTEAVDRNLERAAADTRRYMEDMNYTLGAIGERWIEAGKTVAEAAGLIEGAKLPPVPLPPAAPGEEPGKERYAWPEGMPRPLMPEDIKRQEELARLEQEMITQREQADWGEWTPDDAAIGFMWEFARALEESVALGGDLTQVMADMTSRVLVGFGDAVEGAFQAFAEGSVSAGEAFKNAMLGALGAVARGFGEFFLAQATGEIAKAIGNPLTAGQHLAAAAKYTAAATAMFALSGALKGAGAAGGGAAGGAVAATSELETGRGEVTVYIEGGLLDVTDPRQQDAFARMLENISGRRVIVRGG